MYWKPLDRSEQVRAEKTTVNPFVVGDVVRIETGPLVGLTGIVSAKEAPNELRSCLAYWAVKKNIKISADALLRVS